MSLRKSWLIINLLAVSVVVLHHLLFILPGLVVEPWIANTWFAVRGKVPPPPGVAVIGLDERSYQELGLSLIKAWPRDKLAQLLERLAEHQPQRVVLDLLLSATHDDPLTDERLARALALSPTVIAVGTLSNEQGDVIRPRELFSERAEVASIILEADHGVIRRFKSHARDPALPPLTLAEAAAGVDRRAERPSDIDFINYYGPARTIRYFSVYELLAPHSKIPPGFFRDKVVFVGMTMRQSSKDYFTIPLGRSIMDGVEIHATAAANIMHKQWIRRARPEVEILGLTLALFVLTLLIFSFNPTKAALVWAGSTLAWGCGSYQAFLHGYFVPGLLLFGVVLPLVFTLSALYYYKVTHRAQRWIKDAFKHYLSPALVEAISREPEKLRLGGEKAEATILFSDIEGFTHLVEKCSPDKVSALLNDYFGEVADAVLERNGTLIKFVGDGMYALWNVPVAMADASDRAVKAAINLQERIAALAKEGKLPVIRTRVGIHRGEVVAGNLGTKKRFDYTAVGDAVNLASRLEQLNKKYGTLMLLTDTVAADLKEQYQFVPMGKVRVYGRDEVVNILSLFPAPLSEAALASWNGALAMFQAGCWEGARDAFLRAAQLAPELGKPSELFMHEIELRRLKPLPEGWQGELVFNEK